MPANIQPDAMARTRIRARATRAESPPESGGAVPGPLRDLFTRLTGQAESSDHVFGSPLGPFTVEDRFYWIPRFAYFGPHFSDASIRLAIYAGADGSDARPTRAVARLLERLILKPDLGQGLHLAFFPAVNPTGLELGRRANHRGVDLGREHWNLSAEPEISLLAGDARAHAYQGFVRIEAAPIVQPAAVIRSGSQAASARDTELMPPSVAGEPFPVRWVVDASPSHTSGPLSIAEDLVHGPFEVALALPNVWSDEVFAEAAAQILRRFFVHYRAAYAYGIHL